MKSKLLMWFALNGSNVFVSGVVIAILLAAFAGIDRVGSWISGSAIGAWLVVWIGSLAHDWLNKTLYAAVRAVARLPLRLLRRFPRLKTALVFMGGLAVLLAIVALIVIGAGLLPREGVLALVAALIIAGVGLAGQVVWFLTKWSRWRALNSELLNS